jgi:hypothetical protein
MRCFFAVFLYHEIEPETYQGLTEVCGSIQKVLACLGHAHR